MSEETVIDARAARPRMAWRELWQHRELLIVFVHRDIAVRYQQTALGLFWAVLQPLGFVAVFSFAFGRVARVAAGDAPYPLYVFAALLPWLLFANAVTAAGQSVLSNRSLVAKVFFPRLVLPLSAIGAPLVDFVVATVLMLGLLLAYGRPLDIRLALVPLIALHTVVVAAGVGSLAAALMVRYRDMRHALPFVMSAWMFLTPVFYSPAFVPERWQWLLYANPMAGIVEAMRFAALGQPLDTHLLSASALAAALLLVSGVGYFRSAERRFADFL
jgi:lipopolysaccharide transport system permease protein